LTAPEADEDESFRLLNLPLLLESIVAALKAGETDRCNTVSRWLTNGFSIINAAGDEPLWNLTAERVESLRLALRPAARRELGFFLKRIDTAAKMVDLLGDVKDSSVPQVKKETAAWRARPKPIPMAAEIERVAAFLLDAARSGRNKIGGAKPKVVLLYMDLLALGLRKSGALVATAADFDEYFFAPLSENDSGDTLSGVSEKTISADLIANETKTPAGFRVVPLGESPHRGSAVRILALVQQIKNQNTESAATAAHHQTLIKFVARTEYRRHLRKTVDAGATDLRQLDRALAEAGEKCGLERFTPHSFRHASVSDWLGEGCALPEVVAKYHGHAELATTFEHYVHGTSGIQKKALEEFLSLPENEVWIAAPDAAKLLSVSKQYIYRLYPARKNSVRQKEKGEELSADSAREEQSPRAILLKRPGNPHYLSAAAIVAAHLRGEKSLTGRAARKSKE